MFGNKPKQAGNINDRVLYEPEVIDEKAWRYSTWRKPTNLHTASRFHIQRYINIERRITKMIDFYVLIVALAVVVCFVKLLFFTDYERAVMTDGTQLSCVIDPQGNISPYAPPRIETKVLKDKPLRQEQNRDK